MAGTATWTRSDRPRGMFRYAVAWTSTAGGAVSGNAETVAVGYLTAVEFVPGATTPSADYDITLLDQHGFDRLFGEGADLSASAAKMRMFDPPQLIDGTLDLVVANAGNAKNGTVYIWLQVPPN